MPQASDLLEVGLRQGFSSDQVAAALRGLDDTEVERLAWMAGWVDTRHEFQVVPEGAWSTWLVLAGRGSGKALALDTEVPTPGGWSSIGSIRAGDKLYGADGSVQTVLATHDVNPDVSYEIRLSDGSAFKACVDHQWLTTTHKQRKQAYRNGLLPSASVRSTGDIVETLRHGKRGDRNHAIPVCGPIYGPHETSLPYEPYLLGLWLGDGHTKAPVITCHVDDLPHYVSFIGEHVLRPDRRNPRVTNVSVKALSMVARTCPNKVIPKIYLRASSEQRMAMLQGLMDTDGSADEKKGTVEFCNTKKHIAELAFELAASLGQKPVIKESAAKLYGREVSRRWRVTWRPTAVVFRLPRKAAKLSFDRAQKHRNTHRMIVGAKLIPNEPMRCLTVTGATYLVGRAMVPTHNTRLGAEWTGMSAAGGSQDYRGLVIAPTKGDLRGVCFEGDSGLMRAIPSSLIRYYHKTPAPEIVLHNGALIGGIAAVAFERTRGPNWHRAWTDEVAAWGEDGKVDPEEVWDVMTMSVRLGQDTRILATTTPKPKPLIKRLVADPATVITTASTHVNLDNLSPEFARRIMTYQGTKIGRQEIFAELIDAEEGGIISRSWLQLWPKDRPFPTFEYIVMSLDTAFSEESHDKKKQKTDPSACSVWGCFRMPNGKPGIMLLDCWAEHLGLPDLVDKVKSESKARYGQSDRRPLIAPQRGPKNQFINVGRPIDVIVIEGKASGKSLRQYLAKAGIPTQDFNPGLADKLTRTHVVSPIASNGYVWVPESTGRPGKFMSWAEPLVEQLCSYSGEGTVLHDDLLDTTTQAWRVIDWQWLHYLEDARAKAKGGIIEPPPQKRFPVNPYAQ